MSTLSELWQEMVGTYVVEFLSEADARVRSLEDEVTSLRTQLAISEQNNSYLVNQINGLNTQISQLQAEVEGLRKQLEATYDDVVDGNVQAVLNAKPEGATIKLAPEVYRITAPLTPKNNQKIFAPGATFKGSVTVGTWEKEGNFYVATVPLPAGPYVDSGVCEIIAGPDANGCRVLEDVFNGGKKLTRVMQKANLGPGKVWSDYATKKVYIADVPDNAEVALTRYFMNSTASGVRVSGFTVSQFASPSQQGALTIGGKDWEVDNCLFAYNHSSGLHVTGADGLHAHHNTMDANGQAGMTHHRTNDSVIEYNVFTANNTNDYYRRDWESAGFKMTYSNRVRLQFNRSEKNLGIGIWADIDNKDCFITDNFIADNFSCGIRYEISFDGEIKRNTIVRNGFGHAGPGRGTDYSGFATSAIHVNGAGGMGNGTLLIEDNNIGVVVNTDGTIVAKGNANQGALHLEERFRGASKTYPAVTWTTRNVKVRNNRINITKALDVNGLPWYGTGVVGMGVLGSTSKSIYERTTGNEFVGNKYYAPNSTDLQFHVYDTAINQYRTFKRWQELGWDVGGSLTVYTT